jgi:hypothetical protein
MVCGIITKKEEVDYVSAVGERVMIRASNGRSVRGRTDSGRWEMAIAMVVGDGQTYNLVGWLVGW